MNVLETRGLSKSFGGVHVARDIDFRLEPGEIHCLIGPNGAGKSTTLHAIMGLVTSQGGEVAIGGVRVTGKPPEAIARSGTTCASAFMTASYAR